MALQSKHISWILDSAREGFVKKIKELEAEKATHLTLLKAGEEEFMHESHFKGYQSRNERITEIDNWRAQYLEIMEFLNKAKERAVEVSAKEFAEMFRGQFSGITKKDKKV